MPERTKMKAALHGVALTALRLALLCVLFVLTLAPSPSRAQKNSPAAQKAPAAASLADYRRRVEDARIDLEVLAEEEERDAGWEAKVFGEVREHLPKTEKVEWGGGVVEVNNAWLHDALEAYGKTADKLKGGEREERLSDIAARLSALEARLDEAGAGGARDKDAEKGRLNSILRGRDYAQQSARGNALRGLIEDFLEWLRNLFPETEPMQPATRGRLSVGAQVFIFALAALVLAYIFRRYWLRRASGRRKEKRREARVVLGERLEADQTAADLLEEAERMAREGNLRGAIRKAYVALLCELGDRKVIRLAQHKTNRDYLQAVRGAAPRLYPELLPLTFNFELHWYGLQDASESDWADFRDRCRTALGAL